MNNLNVFLTWFDAQTENFDPRGGRVVNTASFEGFNNLHVPYRGHAVDFQAPPITPNGVPNDLLSFLPFDNGLGGFSEDEAYRTLAARDNGVSSPENAQIFYRGLGIGVTV